MDKTELSWDDLTILIEATKAWVHKDTAGDLIGDMLGMMVLGDKMDKDEYKRDMTLRSDSRQKERLLREEKSIILQSKLLQIRAKLQPTML
jgi:hypothetical protein